jgi:hypothetical protein
MFDRLNYCKVQSTRCLSNDRPDMNAIRTALNYWPNDGNVTG